MTSPHPDETPLFSKLSFVELCGSLCWISVLFNIFMDVEGHRRSLLDRYRMGIQECWMDGILGNGAFQEDLEILEEKAVSVNLGYDEKQGGLLLGDVTRAWSWWDKNGAQA